MIEVVPHSATSCGNTHMLVSLLVIAVDNGRLVVVMTESCQNFSREPSREDWKQFSKHAHRVRMFTDEIKLRMIFASRTYQLSPKAIATISRFLNDEAMQNANYRLFPRLNILHVEEVVSDCWVPKYLPYLSRDTLRTLEFKCAFRRSTVVDDSDVHVSWSAVVPLMRSAWPCLRSIELYFRNWDCDSRGPISERCSQFLGPWFESLAHLESLKAYVPPHSSLLPALSMLPLLDRLDLNVSRSPFNEHRHVVIDAKLPLLSSPCFSSLTSVRITGDASTLESIILLFQGLKHSTQLDNISLSFCSIPNTPHSAMQLLNLFEAISHIHSVAVFYIHVGKEWKGSNLVLSGALFSMLFPLHELCFLHLHGNFDITVDDRDLANAAAAWPQIMELELPHYDPANPSKQSRITLIGIQALYKGCPFLGEVFMQVGCTLPTVDDCVKSAQSLPSLPIIDGSGGTSSQKVSTRRLHLTFIPPDPEINPDPFYYDWESAQCMAVAIRVMLPAVNAFSFSCRADQFWAHDVSTTWSSYQRCIPKQASIRALWEQMLRKRNGTGSGDDDGWESSDQDD